MQTHRHPRAGHVEATTSALLQVVWFACVLLGYCLSLQLPDSLGARPRWKSRRASSRIPIAKKTKKKLLFIAKRSCKLMLGLRMCGERDKRKKNLLKWSIDSFYITNFSLKISDDCAVRLTVTSAKYWYPEHHAVRSLNHECANASCADRRSVWSDLTRRVTRSANSTDKPLRSPWKPWRLR